MSMTSKLQSGIVLTLAAALAGCSSGPEPTATLPPAQFVSPEEGPGANYVIGPLDALNVFVWRNPELSANVQVRPDGRITMPLITDLAAAGQTPTQLGKSIEEKLGQYIQNPIVSVIVTNFNGPLSQQVRIVGQATRPTSLPYRANMTLLDAMIAVGGLTDLASGNKARLVRFDKATGTQKEFAVKIDSLLKRGDTSANVKLEPGDVIIIPESTF